MAFQPHQDSYLLRPTLLSETSQISLTLEPKKDGYYFELPVNPCLNSEIFASVDPVPANNEDLVYGSFLYNEFPLFNKFAINDSSMSFLPFNNQMKEKIEEKGVESTARTSWNGEEINGFLLGATFFFTMVLGSVMYRN
jgi:hypothetical protein